MHNLFGLDLIPNIRCPYYYTDNIKSIDPIPCDNSVAYQQIYNRRKEIMELFDNNETDQILAILEKLNIVAFEAFVQINIQNVMQMQWSKLDIDHELFAYSISHLDMDFFYKIISKNKRKDLFSPRDDIVDNKLIAHIVQNYNLCEIILNLMDLTPITIESYIYHIIQFQKISSLDLFFQHGLYMNTEQIEFAIKLNCLEVMEYILSNNYYNVQDIFNNYNVNMSNRQSVRYNKFVPNVAETVISIDMLKMLTKYGIDLSMKNNDILQYASRTNLIDIVTYCIKSGLVCDLNSALQHSCLANRINIMIYLLQNGADINCIEDYNIRDNAEIIKFLIESGYEVPILKLSIVFMTEFVSTDNIPDILWLVEYGADPCIIFDRETYLEKNPTEMRAYGRNKHPECSNSHLEYLVGMGKMSHIKYLADIHFDKLQLELDRLIIIACTNGQIPMVEFLLDLGADITAKDNLSLKSACYFGQIDIVKLILSKGIDIHNITDNLFMFVAYGPADKECFHIESSYYNKLVEYNLIFRNDLYQYVNYHADIINLLIAMNYIAPPAVLIFAILTKELLTTELISYMITNKIDISESFLRHPHSICDIKNLSKFCSKPICILELSVLMGNYAVTKLLLENGQDVRVNDGILMVIAEELNYVEIGKLLAEYISD